MIGSPRTARFPWRAPTSIISMSGSKVPRFRTADSSSRLHEGGAGRADLYYDTFMTRGHADSGGLCRAACPLRLVRRGPGGSQVRQPSLTIQHLAPNEEVALVFRSRIADPRQDLKIACIASDADCGGLVCFRKSHGNRQPNAIARSSACEHAT